MAKQLCLILVFVLVFGCSTEHKPAATPEQLSSFLVEAINSDDEKSFRQLFHPAKTKPRPAKEFIELYDQVTRLPLLRAEIQELSDAAIALRAKGLEQSVDDFLSSAKPRPIGSIVIHFDVTHLDKTSGIGSLNLRLMFGAEDGAYYFCVY